MKQVALYLLGAASGALATWLLIDRPIAKDEILWWAMQGRATVISLPIRHPQGTVLSTLHLHSDGTWSLSSLDALNDLAAHGRSNLRDFDDMENFAEYTLQAGKVQVDGR